MKEQESNKRKFYFTFRSSSHQEGKSLANYYTIIEAETEHEARVIMIERRGSEWYTSYDSYEKAGIEKCDLKFIPFDEVTAQNGETL